jgi:iron complex outermembrane receptor protein
MKIKGLPILCLALLCYCSVNAQTQQDSLTIIRAHQQADSILRAISGGQSGQMATPKASSRDSIIKSLSEVEAHPANNNWQNADSATRAKWRARHASIDSLSGISTPDSTTRAKWKSKRAGADSTGGASKWRGNQNGGGGAPSGNGGGAMGGMVPANLQSQIQIARMSIGHIYGKVIDGQNKKPMSYVSVSLYTMKDSLVTGQLTEDNGDFSFSDLRAGAYNVKVSFLGYKEILTKVIITPAKSEQDIGNLTISPDATHLKEVDVTSQKSTLELKVDRKVFNVGNDISSRGGTGLDAMKNIPSVSIDANGNVTLRNNTPQVYIDGKPTTLTLEQIPADQIDKIEVITNPSAKYEAASSGGIINVVMKKNTKPGYNGMVNMNIATNDGYNGLAVLNLKEKKFGVMLLYTVNGATNRTYGYNNYTPLDSLNRSNSNTYTNQAINTTFKRLFQVARVGFDFFINNRNTLSLSQTAVFGNFNTTDNLSITNDSAGVKNNGSEVNAQLAYFRNLTTDITFKHTYPKEGKEYTLDFRYNYAEGGTNYLYTITPSDASGNIPPGAPYYENLIGGQHSDQFTAQGDFSLPIGKNIKIETGFRSNYKLTYSYNNVTNQSTINDSLTSPVANFGLSNNYRIDDLVNGAYITFTHKIKEFSYQLGFRVEEVYYKGTSVLNSDSAFGYQYPTSWSSVPDMLFPSFNLSQKFGKNQEIQFNVARKSNRPNFYQIAPFVFSSTYNSVQKGNPALAPEFVNQGELNYDLSLDKINWLSSVYGRYTQQPITTYVSILPGNNQVLLNSFANGTHSVAGGWENTFKIFPVKKLDITLTGNVFYTDIVGSSVENNQTNQGWSWLAKAIISYKLPGDVTVQVNGTYEAPKIVPQGKTIPLYYFDASLSRDFGFFTINLTVSDVMNSKASGTDLYQASVLDPQTDIYIPRSGFIQDTSRRRDQRYAKLGVSFKFGKIDSSLFKKKKPQLPDQGGDLGF